MALSEEEIRANLTRFAAAWDSYEGSEKGEAQALLNELRARELQIDWRVEPS